MVLLKKRITKVLIRLGGCAGWSAPLLFTNPKDRFSRDEAQLSSVYLMRKLCNPLKIITLLSHDKLDKNAQIRLFLSGFLLSAFSQ